MAKLELAFLVGDESKKWLAELTKQLDRLEDLKLDKVVETASEVFTEAEEEDDDDEVFVPAAKTSKKAAKSFDDDDEVFVPAAKTSKKAAKSFDDDEEEEEEEETEYVEDDADEEIEDDVEEEEAEEEDDDDEEEEPAIAKKPKAAKKSKAKKLTIDDCNDAAHALCIAWGGKSGRPKVLKLLKKHFKVESVQDLKPEQYAELVEVFTTAAKKKEK